MKKEENADIAYALNLIGKYLDSIPAEKKLNRDLQNAKKAVKHLKKATQKEICKGIVWTCNPDPIQWAP